MGVLFESAVGDDRAFERLYRSYAQSVFRYACAVLGQQADAEDVTQTTFMNAYRALRRGERPLKPENWLIAITHNACRERFRRAERQPREVALERELLAAASAGGRSDDGRRSFRPRAYPKGRVPPSVGATLAFVAGRPSARSTLQRNSAGATGAISTSTISRPVVEVLLGHRVVAAADIECFDGFRHTSSPCCQTPSEPWRQRRARRSPQLSDLADGDARAFGVLVSRWPDTILCSGPLRRPALLLRAARSRRGAPSHRRDVHVGPRPPNAGRQMRPACAIARPSSPRRIWPREERSREAPHRTSMRSRRDGQFTRCAPAVRRGAPLPGTTGVKVPGESG